MLVVIGYVVVVVAVLGGYALTGGHMGALYQPAELIIIGGAAVGARGGQCARRIVGKTPAKVAATRTLGYRSRPFCRRVAQW